MVYHYSGTPEDINLNPMTPFKGRGALYTDLSALSCKAFIPLDIYPVGKISYGVYPTGFIIRYAGYCSAAFRTIFLFTKAGFFSQTIIKASGNTAVTPQSVLKNFKKPTK